MTASRSAERQRSESDNGRAPQSLTVAVTGTSGRLGPAVLDVLSGHEEVRRVIVLNRRPPEQPEGDAEVDYRPTDIRDRAAVERNMEGADAVIHMAFALYGVASREPELFENNVEGTLNVARAAAQAKVRRFVYTSSGVVYGFHEDNPQPLTEEADMRASSKHFYARHKAQSELLVNEQFAGTDVQLYTLRPCAIAGPHAMGAIASGIPSRVRRLGLSALRGLAAAGVRPISVAPPLPFQYVHEDDVVQAAVLSALGRGPAGTYNLAAEDVIDGAEALRLLGFRIIPAPRALSKAVTRGLASLPGLVPAHGWTEAFTHPVLLDSSKARDQLGWEPQYSSRDALRSAREAAAG